MKLKCEHDKRVMVTPMKNVIHRSDNSKCNSVKRLTLGTKSLTPEQVVSA
jgi:hypothetical protein